MYTISADNEKPSKLMFEMYAWSKMFIFAVDSSMDSFTGIGTFPLTSPVRFFPLDDGD